MISHQYPEAETEFKKTNVDVNINFNGYSLHKQPMSWSDFEKIGFPLPIPPLL